MITSKRQRDAANETKTIEATVDNTNQNLNNENPGNGFRYGNAFAVFYLRNNYKIHSFFTFTRIKKSTAVIFIMSLAGTNILTCLLVMPFTRAVVYLN
ncbi:hypothetical protein MAR_005151 [Mya arenaria]|uniref:Uncharacterized protein n=1 Tax=Mya arenaria TaxID=6604 RepID=A0ABY7F1V8_MYAAR|nr:hypothetical protein MAR_005151 [Mya arenaria]